MSCSSKSAALRIEIQALKNQIAGEKSRIAEAVAEAINSSEAKIQSLNRDIDRLTTTLKATKAEAGALAKDVRELRAAVSEKDALLAEQSEQITRLRTQVSSLTKERDAEKTGRLTAEATALDYASRIQGLVSAHATTAAVHAGVIGRVASGSDVSMATVSLGTPVDFRSRASTVVSPTGCADAVVDADPAPVESDQASRRRPAPEAARRVALPPTPPKTDRSSAVDAVAFAGTEAAALAAARVKPSAPLAPK